MKVVPLALPGVLRVDADVFPDARGFLTEVWQDARYAAHGIVGPFLQDNHSRSVRGTLRGLHWQRRYPQGKLVSVVRGAILDVVADVRPTSPTYRRHVSVRLEEGTGRQLWVPPGYAHGFLVLSDIADVLYKNTDRWWPDDGRGVRWDDPDLAIDWGTTAPILSPQDEALPWLRDVGAEDLP